MGGGPGAWAAGAKARSPELCWLEIRTRIPACCSAGPESVGSPLARCGASESRAWGSGWPLGSSGLPHADGSPKDALSSPGRPHGDLPHPDASWPGRWPFRPRGRGVHQHDVQGPHGREAGTPPSKPLQVSTRRPERAFLPASRTCQCPPASERFLKPV